MTLEEVLSSYSEGPQTGVFTDGGCQPNPGPGGWGYVHVIEGQIIQQGTHNQLLEQEGYYKDLYNKQLSEKEIVN